MAMESQAAAAVRAGWMYVCIDAAMCCIKQTSDGGQKQGPGSRSGSASRLTAGWSRPS